MQIHPNFKLFLKSFDSADELIAFLKPKFETDANFLEELFNEEEYIIVKTSGSTGTPKPIKIKKEALLKSAENTGKYFKLGNETKALHCLSSEYIAGKMMWVRALHLGWHLTLVKPNRKPLENIDASFDFAAMLPLQVQNSYEKLTQINKLIIGGAPLDAVWEEKLSQFPNEIYLTYGMTETITHVAVRKIGEKKIFHCLPDIKIEIDKRGCLMITALYIAKEPVITNDIVTLHSESSFEWLGRFDNVINSGGIKFLPEMLEEKLANYLTKPFVISSKKDQMLSEKLVLVIGAPPFDIDKDTLFENAGLKQYEKPKEIVFIDYLPVNENSKINRIDVKLIIDK